MRRCGALCGGYGRELRRISDHAVRGVRPHDADARRVGPVRPDPQKKGSNDDWTHPHDPDARLAKMKDGRTHLAHTAEHAVDWTQAPSWA